ncbi:MAG: aminomethyl-transferring glycine dehydrogenase, partial [Eubacteriales bacterium]|nr:aminomethyl-transferring glycine dehydrogenase [Eubacteriales bacterium]
MAGYVPATPAQQQEMLHSLGYADWEALYADVPEAVRRAARLKLPAGKSEAEVRREMERLAAENHVYATVLRGAGAYRHYIPAVVRHVASKEEFVTAYTPYQPEISQGLLQSIFEYQIMICQLTGMDVSNASVYDGASAAGEAAAMCRERGRRATLVSETAHPDVVATVRTYCA